MEADIRCLLYAKHATNEGTASVLIICEGIDVILLSYILKTEVAPNFLGVYHGLSFSLSKLFYVDSLCWCK